MVKICPIDLRGRSNALSSARAERAAFGRDCKFYTEARGSGNPARLRFYFEHTTITRRVAFLGPLFVGESSADRLSRAPDPRGLVIVNNSNRTLRVYTADCAHPAAP
jgi:hypothetical protein